MRRKKIRALNFENKPGRFLSKPKGSGNKAVIKAINQGTMKESIAFGQQMQQLGCNVVIHAESGMVSVSPPNPQSQKDALKRSTNS